LVTRAVDLADVWAWLAEVPDPEIPVISVLDLGIVRDVTWSDAGGVRTLHVAITPTYSGCPAMRAIESDIVARLALEGIERVKIDVRLAPPWTTDWLSDSGREKLRAYGISPPRMRADDPNAPIDLIGIVEELAACPRCGSRAVELISRFASTPCKALYRCTTCREPFDHFKRH
jgi:ring-1,2-phenylacetyl-CoA epoxidase subunit PaaD